MNEKLKKYMQHLPECNKNKDWSEAYDAFSYTPHALRDHEWSEARAELDIKANTCTCGLDETFAAIESGSLPSVVGQLQWEEPTDVTSSVMRGLLLKASTPIWDYEIWNKENIAYEVVTSKGLWRLGIAVLYNKEQAKAAAQSHYNTLVGSCLVGGGLPTDEEVSTWYDQWIETGCSASSAIYKFRSWLRDRGLTTDEKTMGFAEWLNVNEWNQLTADNGSIIKGHWGKFPVSQNPTKTTNELFTDYLASLKQQ